MKEPTNKELLCKQESQFFLTVYKLVVGYCGVITDGLHTLWRKDFSCPETANKESLRVFNSILLTDQYLSLSEKYYKEYRYYQSVADDKEAQVYLKKAFVYKDKYYKSKGLDYLQ